tara:strand:+ start:435 stop:599 length:165 start_codon:yes stop_codon:yes gene_type:complete
MSEDIFIPLSKPQDAIVGPLDTITWLTNNSQDLEDILINGFQIEMIEDNIKEKC